jgi:hypothetical protein
VHRKAVVEALATMINMMHPANRESIRNHFFLDLAKQIKNDYTTKRPIADAEINKPCAGLLTRFARLLARQPWQQQGQWAPVRWRH